MTRKTADYVVAVSQLKAIYHQNPHRYTVTPATIDK